MTDIYRITRKATFYDIKFIELTAVSNGKLYELFIAQHLNTLGSISAFFDHRKEIEIDTAGDRIENIIIENSKTKREPFIEKTEVKKIQNQPGVFYPRIYRPQLVPDQSGHRMIVRQLEDCFASKPYFIPHVLSTLVSSVQQLQIILKELVAICETVYPDPEITYKSYGHRLRNLLIIACTEVEAQMKGILRENGFKEEMPRMKHYKKLHDILKLKSYSMHLSFFPNLPPVTPFRDWEEKLFWYHAYGDVKHDREQNFRLATLENVINAVVAIPILLIAQYGDNLPHWNELIGSYFSFVELPKWEFDECYIPPFKNHEWKSAPIFK